MDCNFHFKRTTLSVWEASEFAVSSVEFEGVRLGHEDDKWLRNDNKDKIFFQYVLARRSWSWMQLQWRSRFLFGGGELRYCQKCSHYKPPRAHHCRVCKRCVLRMDHHCIWINNCVGHANYKVFFVFVVYAVIACIHSLVLLVFSGAHVAQEDEHQAEGSIRTSYIISGLLLTPLTIALSILLSWHIYLILCNKTTIEYHEGVRAMWLAKKVLGPNIFAWVCPTSKHIGSGMRFKTGYDETALLGSSE